MQSLGIQHNSITKNIAAGAHHIKYSLDKYAPVEFDITVVGGQPKTYHKTLMKQEAEFAITSISLSESEGSAGDSITAYLRIKNNGNLAAPTDVWGVLKSGLKVIESGKSTTPSIGVGATISYNYVFSVPDITAGTGELSISVGILGVSVDDTRKVTFVVKPATGRITFSTTPEHGVSVYVDGVKIGVT